MGEDYTKLIPLSVLNARNLARLRKEVVQDVYNYWKKKRLAVGKPLIERLQIEEDELRHSTSYVRAVLQLLTAMKSNPLWRFRNKSASTPKCAKSDRAWR